MAKCDEGYRCEVCGEYVELLTESQLYLLYVVGELDPELLHTTPDCHIRCNPVIAQFIVDDDFKSVQAEGPFRKQQLDGAFVAERERLMTRGYQRLKQLAGQEISILDYPLPEIKSRWEQQANEG